jgi:hypothetical protein
MSNLIPPRRGEFVTKSGDPTLRFTNWMESLTTQSNVATVITNTISNSASVRAQLFALQEQVGSGDFLTSDDTGFTVDSIKLTVDMTEA